MALETTYTVTAKSAGIILFKFNLQGDLVYFEFQGEPFTDKQRKWFYPRLPINEKMMGMWEAIKEFTVTKGLPKLDFDAFWDAYNLKSKKLVCQELWKKLKDDDRFNAIVFIKRYDNWLRIKGTAKALPDTYLRQKRWLDEL